MIECGVAASGDVLCLWRCCCLSAVLAARQAMLPYPTLPLLHRSRVHLRLSSSVLAVHLHLHGLGSSTSPNGNVLRLATGFVFTPLGTSHVALHCLRLALARVHSACCICAFVLGVELDLAVLFILVVFAIEISLSSNLFSSLIGFRVGRTYSSPSEPPVLRRTYLPVLQLALARLTQRGVIDADSSNITVISLGDLSGPPVASPVCDDLRNSPPAPCQRSLKDLY